MYNFQATVIDWPKANPPIEGFEEGMELSCHCTFKDSFLAKVDVGGGQLLFVMSHLQPIPGTEYVTGDEPTE